MIGRLQMALVEAREDLKDARADLRVCQARTELAAIEAAGSAKNFGESEEIRKRKLVLVVAEDPDCRILADRVSDLERTVANLEARFERALRAIRFYEWQIRSRLTDTLDRLANRPCTTNLEHQLQTLLAEATGEKGIYAGEADLIEEARVS